LIVEISFRRSKLIIIKSKNCDTQDGIKPEDQILRRERELDAVSKPPAVRRKPKASIEAPT
jgi:hypothetical protein